MSTLSQLTLVHGDAKAAAALSFAFEREGTEVSLATSKDSLLSAIKDGCQLVITGATDKKEANSQLAMIQEATESCERRVPILYFGNAISRDEAMKEGANEFLGQPAYLRDVITLGKLMATPMERRTQSISGELSEHFGLFYIVRALGTIKYNGVLTLLRGLRRGELRFYEGQATSAQLGGLHGLSGLHQMLLWTNARFDLREEKVVHRRQIPLTHTEVLQDCERFLREIRTIAGPLSPSAVLAVDDTKDVSVLPKPVREVLRLFNGTSSVADVIEDSPFQNFETLRIACRLIDQSIITQANNQAPIQLSTTALSIDEWLVSGQIRSSQSAEVAGTQEKDGTRGKPVSPPEKGKSNNRKRRRKTRPTTQSLAEVEKQVVRNEKSWSDVLPSQENMEELAPVVPATEAVGEINVSSPSSRATKEMSNPTAPTRERIEEQGASSLCNIFIDEDLTQEKPLGKNADLFSWEEETAPAMQLGIADEPDNLDGEDQALAGNWEAGAEDDDSQLPEIASLDSTENGLFEAKAVSSKVSSENSKTSEMTTDKLPLITEKEKVVTVSGNFTEDSSSGEKAVKKADKSEDSSSAEVSGKQSVQSASDESSDEGWGSMDDQSDKTSGEIASKSSSESLDRASGEIASKSSSENSSSESLDKASGENASKSSLKSSLKSSSESLDKASGEIASKSSSESSDKASGEISSKSSSETSSESLDKASGEISSKSTSETSDKASGEISSKSLSESLDKASGEIASKSTSETSDKASGEISSKSSSETSSESLDKASGEIASKSSSETPDKASGENASKSSSAILDKASGEIASNSSSESSDKASGEISSKSSSENSSSESLDQASGEISSKSSSESSDKASGEISSKSSSATLDKASGEISSKSSSESLDKASSEIASKSSSESSDKVSDEISSKSSSESLDKASSKISSKSGVGKANTKEQNDMYKPKEVALAHKRVRAAAADGVLAYRAAKDANALVRKPKTENEGVPSEKISNEVSTQVEEVAAAAESAAAQALDFSAEEEAFFSRGVEQAKIVPPPVDNFEDLDEDYEIPKTFWARFMRDPRKDNRKKKG